MGTSKVSFTDARGFLGNKICRKLRAKKVPAVKETGVLMIKIF